MSLHEIARTHGVQRTDTCKLFWGQYGYALKMAIPAEWHEERREALHVFWQNAKKTSWKQATPKMRSIHAAYRAKVQQAIDAVITANADTFNIDDFYYQSSETNSTFYVKSADIAAKLIVDNPKVFHTYQAPASKAVETHLHKTAGTRLLVREKRWYDVFDYKVTLKRRTFDVGYEDVDARVANLRFVESLYSKGDRRILYVAGEDDFFLAKLALSDLIESVDRCVTTEEVEQDAA